MKLKHLFENKMNAEQAYKLAIQKGTPVPEYEDIIAKDSRYAYLYAENIIKGRFPAGEPKITKDSWYAYLYAKDIIKGRFPAGEPAITKDSWYAYRYKLFLYNNDINFDDLEEQPSKKGPLVVDDHIISNIPNHVKYSQLIKLMKLSFPGVENSRIVEFLLSKQQSSKEELPVVTWTEYMDKNEQKYKPQENDFS